MIEFIKGELAALDSDKAVVEVGGVGFGVYMSGQALGMLPQPGHMVKLYTYLNVKEDALQLYGFLTRDDLEIFRLLIGVSGIGPKGALGILSGLTPVSYTHLPTRVWNVWNAAAAALYVLQNAS